MIANVKEIKKKKKKKITSSLQKELDKDGSK